jgi:poly(A) polymerase/tRNA nucleotidyltransferase (CCA-adding enzyme)
MNIPDYVLRIAKELQRQGFEGWIVGGSIRDLLFGKTASDYDIATNATPDQLRRIFRRTVPTGIKHGTVTVVCGSHSVEVTTFRSDGKYSDFRRPDSITYAKTILEDLSRRDFTINAMAYNPITGELLDPYGGKSDLERRIIRTVGDPLERFKEDGLRPYRACRFAAQLGFSIEEKTFQAILACLESASKVSMERIRDEFIKIIQSPKPSTGIELLRTSGLLEGFLPELLTGFGINQNKYHRFDIYYHNLYTCDAALQDNLCIRLAALFHDIGKFYAKREVEGKGGGTRKSVFYNHEIIGAAITRKIMRRLKFSNQEIKLVTHLIRYHMFHYTNQWTDGAVRRFIRKVGIENLDALFELRRADRIGNGLKSGESRSIQNLKKRIEKVIEEANAITVKDLAVNGYDIMNELIIKPGPMVGKILNHLLEEILDDPSKNQPGVLLALARDFYNKINAPEPLNEGVSASH